MIIQAFDLTKSFLDIYGNETRVLHGIDLQISAGEMVAIVGPSGSGKSTLLNCLSGLERPTSGAVRVGETDIGGARAKDLAVLRRATIGFIFQQYNLLDSLTVSGNVELQARLAGLPVSNAQRALETVGISDKQHQKPSLLSGGEQQRVAIARALAVTPRVLFADEPTGSLGSVSGARVIDLLRALAVHHGSAVLLVTHDLEAAASADRVLVLKDGLIHAELEAATPQSLLAMFQSITTNAARAEVAP